MTYPDEPPRQFWPSMAALAVGLAVVFAVSWAAVQACNWLELPAAKFDRWMLIAGGVAVTAGAYVTARLAPRRPLRHAIEMGVLAVAIKLALTFGGIASGALPIWETFLPHALVLPAAWLGGRLYAGRRAR